MSIEFTEADVRRICAQNGMPLPAGLEPEGPTPKRRKYGNNPTERDGRTFDSKHEADRYDELMLMLKAGEIHGVLCQHPFILPGGVVYRADFVELDKGGTWHVEDAKSVATARDKAYRIKKRQMRECLGIEVHEV